MALLRFLLFLLFVLGALISLSWIALQQQLFLNFLSSEDNKNFFSALSGISNALTVFIALANITAIAYFYFRDKLMRQKEELFSKRLYWFRSVLLEKNIDRIEEFFLRNEQIIGDLSRLRDRVRCDQTIDYENSLVECVGQYTDEKRKISRSFVNVARVTSTDLGNDIAALFVKFQDEFTDAVEEFFEGGLDEISFVGKVQDQKQRLLSVLYEYGINDCQLPKQRSSFYVPILDGITRFAQRRYSRIIRDKDNADFSA